MSLTRQDIEATTIKFLSEEFEVDPSTITPEAPMKETLALDSLDYVDLVVVIEQNFGMKMKGEQFMKLVTFSDFYDHIEEELAAKA
ncbi:MAG: acyl carrier protein [Flavobacteriales bacterium]|nr:acyl carrier protein [Flavobacteriales bacterium]MBK6943469.1 acyl carrier protein [Flavobacteriales bacterium]MBK7240644.1 acyl carrier protein [Flavobacteriales bacterium]MBK9535994.1 acyl carrier protein [Flavobacteriales bacterium]MBP9139989.1 acyl carrier protein [Flavobacteriales bacterium]